MITFENFGKSTIEISYHGENNVRGISIDLTGEIETGQEAVLLLRRSGESTVYEKAGTLSENVLSLVWTETDAAIEGWGEATVQITGTGGYKKKSGTARTVVEHALVSNGNPPSPPSNYRTKSEQDAIDNTKLSDAPTDSKTYGRKNGEWTEVTGGGAGAVRYDTAQELTAGQKTQARSNIGAGTYSKPANGIPDSDLASTFIKEHQSLAAYRTSSAQDIIDNAIIADVSDIEALIPAQATAENQLADKGFVNSSVATNTAYYISNNGQPFTSVAQLEAYSGTVTNNDYAFVTGQDESGNTYFDRYKATVAGASVTWAKEYRLNNSSFTAAQWAAITSGITSEDVAKIGTAYTHSQTSGNPHGTSKSDVGLGNVDNVRQYSANNPPPSEIDDTAGAGDTDKTWSADKLSSDLQGKPNYPNHPSDNKFYAMKNDEWTEFSGGGGGSVDYFTVVNGELCIVYEEA